MNVCGSSRKLVSSLGLLLAVGVAALGAILLTGERRVATPAYDQQALGARQHAKPYVHTPAFSATIGTRGYTAGRGATAVTVTALGDGAGNGRWQRFAHGVMRPASYGHETITLAGNAVEQLSTVDRRQGARIWSWQLSGLNLDPSLRADGSVRLGPAAKTRILPVSVFDRSGNDVTPAGARWALRKSERGWLLQLALDDKELPLPYVIDPATVSAVTATATSLAAGAKAHWTIGFTPSNSGALGATDTISVAFPTWTGGALPATPTIVPLTPATFPQKCTATGATVGTTVTLTLGNVSGQTCAVAKNVAATFEILGITNTTTTGAKTITVSTSKDGAANASASIAAATAPAATISFAGGTQAAGAVTAWTVGFKSSATNGALVAGSTITTALNAAFVVTGTPTITLGTGFAGCSATGATAAGPIVTATLADSGVAGSCSLPANTQTSVGISGVTNPSATAYANTSFTVKTLSDSSTASPAGGISIASQTTPTGVSLTASTRAAAATGVTYTASLTPSAAVAGPPPTTGALAAGATITLALPAGTTVPASPTVTPTAGFSNCSLSSPGGSATVVVTLANSGGTCALAAAASGTFTIAGITNAAAGSSTPTVKTSVDQTGASAASLVLFGAATQLVVTTQPSGATGGTAFTTQPVVTVQDAGGRTVANNSSSVTIAIKGGTGTAGAALSGTATVSAANGIATFGGLSIDKSGASYQLHATDGALTAADSSAFSVTAGPASQLAFTQQPAGASGGTAFTTQPKVTVQDAGGNTITTDSSTVTLTIGTNPTGGALSGCSQAESNGVITFSGCKIDKSGTGYALHAADGSLSAADSAGFNVVVGTASQLVFTSGASSVTSGSTKTLTAAVEDAGGNTLVTDNATVVVFSQTAGAGSVTGLGTSTAASGVASLTVTGNVAGSVTTQAAKQGGGLTTPTSTFSVTVGPISTATSTIAAIPASITADGSSTTSITVQAKDGAGNNLSTGGSSITLSTTDGTFPSSCASSCTATDNGNGTYTLTLTSSTTAHAVTVSGKIGGSSMTNTGSVTFAPGPISTATSTIAASAGSITANGSSTTTITVQAKDSHGNDLTAGGSSIKLSTSGGTFPSSCTTDCTATGNGSGAYTLMLTSSTAAGSYTVSGKVGAVAMTHTSGVTFTPGAADHLTFTSNTTSVASGAAKTLTAEIRDANGNLESSDSATVLTFAKTAGAGTATGLGTATAAGGVASLAVTGQTAGAVTVTASTSGLTSDNSTFSVTVGPADHLTFASNTASVASGSGKTLTAEIRDVAGNLESGDNSTVVAFAKTAGAGTVTGLGTATAAGGVATLVATGQTSGSVAVTASKAGLTGDASTFSVTVGPADHVTFTSDTSGVASGSAKTLRAEIRDAAGNLQTADNSTVITFAMTAGAGTVTGLGTATASGGVATLSATGYTAGAVTVTASKSGLTSNTSTFSVTPGAAGHLTFTSNTASVASGAGKTLTAEIRDAAGNLQTADNATVVTFAKTAGAGTVSGLGTATASGGVATLSATGSTAGAVTVTASKSGLTSNTSTFSVTPGAAGHLTFTSNTASVASGSGKTLTAEIRDAAGNLETADNATVVTFAKTAGAGSVTGLGSATAGSGTATLSVTGQSAGSVTITASKAGLTSDSSTFTVDVGPADHVTFTSDTSSVASGSVKTLTAELRDAAGNLQTADNATVVTFAKTAGAGTVAGLGTATAAGGIATLIANGQTAGAVTITASKSGLTSDSSTFSVTVGPADHLTFTSNTTSVASGATKTLTVAVRDAAGNLETADNTTVVSFAQSGTGTVTGLADATVASGIAGLDVTGHTAGALTVTASKPGLTADASSISVTPGAADHVTFTSDASNVASGAAKTLTAELRDANGNLETADNTTVVTFAKTAGAGTVTGLGTATAAVGAATLTVTGQTTGAVTITASRTGLTSDTSAFTVTTGPTDHVSFTSSSADLAAGGTRIVSAEIRDANENVVDDNTTQVTLSQSGAGTVTGLPTTVSASSGTLGASVTGHASGAVTITAHAAGLADATSSFDVLAGSIDANVSTVVAASGTTSTDAGSTNTITVTVSDALGNAIASAPVTLTQGGGHSTVAPSVDGGASGSGTTDASGVATFTVSDATVEGVVYSATAPGTPITETAGVTYTVGSPVKLAFDQQPTNAGAGQTIVPAVTVQVRDAHDHLVASSSAGVSLAVHTNAGGGVLSGGGAASASGGTATFAALSIDQVGNGYTLDATSPGLAAATSTPFNGLVAPGLALSGLTGSVALDGANGHRLYFRPGGSGSFVLTASPAGQASYSFPTISGWTGVQGTGGNLNTITYSYAGATGAATGLAVTYNDGSGASGPTLFDVVDDSTKPAGGAISVPATVSTASVAVATTSFADAEAGIAANVITRSAGQAPSGGVCPAGGYSGATVATTPDTGVVSGNCYVYTLTGTDAVGNADSTASTPVLVDTSAPTDPLLVSISSAGSALYYGGSGATIYVEPGADNTNRFTLTASSTDAQSGVTYTFPHISGFTESAGASPGEEDYVANGPTGSDGGSGTVTSTNGVGTASAGGFSFTAVVDGNGPTGGAFTSPTADTYSTNGHATVAWNGFADGSSGLATLTIHRQVTTLGANACDTASFADDATFSATLATAATSIPAETGLASGSCFRYVTTASDRLGNVTTRTSSSFLVDTTPPAAPTLTSLTKSGADVFVSGSTVYFKPGADNTNTFTAAAATTGDPETGVDAGSWSFAGVPGFTGAAGAAGSETYTASTPTALHGGPGSATVDDHAGLTSAPGAAFSVVADGAPPIGGSFTGVPQYSGDGSVSFSTTPFADAGSGLAAQSVQRQSAAPSGVSCPSSGWVDDGAPVSPSATFTATSLADGTCYRWLLDATDNVGNAATTVVGGPTLVDTSGPSAATVAVDNLANAYVGGSTIYYDASTGGTFRVTAASTPSASGIGAYTFNDASLLSHGFTRGGPGNPAVITFGVGTTDTVGTVTATSNSGVTSPATNFSLVGDGAGPAAPSVSCSPASCTSNAGVSVTLADNGDGSGSGVKEIRYTTDGSDPKPSDTLYSGAFTVSGSATVKAAAIDNLDHVGAVTTQTITVDANPPQPTSTDVSGTSLNIHFDKLLVASANPGASAFTVSVTANGTTVADPVTNAAISGATVTLTLATPVTNAQTASAVYTKPGSMELQDSYANLVASFNQTATLDVTAPSVLSTAASGTSLTLQLDEPLNAAATPAASAFAVTMTAGGSTTPNPVTDVAVSGSLVTLTLGTAVAGFQSATLVYTQPTANALADLAGNVTAGLTKTIALDTTAPHATAAELNGSTLTVHFDEALSSSTPAGSAFAVSLGGLSVAVTGVSISGADATLTLGSAATSGQSASLAYSPPASNKLQDAATNATSSFSLSPTNLTSGGSGGPAPAFTSATPADGTAQAAVSGPVVLRANESVAWSNLGITYVDNAGDAGAWQALPGGTGQTLSVPFAGSAPGLYTVRGTIGDGVTSTGFVTHFTIWAAGSNGVPRPTAKTAQPGTSGSLSTSDHEATVAWPATDVPSTAGDALIVETAPQDGAAMTAPAGMTWSAGGMPVDVTAHTMLTNTPVTTFSDPLLITFPSATPTDVPVVSRDSGLTWRFISPCTSPGVIPNGETDCYAVSGGVLTVWTLHLTRFALVGDHEPPSAPQHLGVGTNGGQIVMRWEPATDNGGQIDRYSILVDGEVVRVLGGKTYEYYAGPATAGDTHVYRVQATDAAGNAGPLSDEYTGVPDLRGLTQQQARDVLASRGFAVGTVGNAGSGAVVSQSPAAPSYARVGSAIDFSLASVARTALDFHVVGTERLDLLTRHYTAVRVQVNQAATIKAALTARGDSLATWTRIVKPGTWILRYALPAGLAPGAYTLAVEATTGTDRSATTIGIRLQRGRILLPGKTRVLVVGDDARRDILSISVPKANVSVTTEANIFEATFWSRDVGVVVVDVDRQGLALADDLHVLFPGVRVVAVTTSTARAAEARRSGVAAVVLARPRTSRIVSAAVSALVNP